ncbi:hypothetical protein KOR42_02860 [Thalassoglobus neptunius]|uniref:Immunity protein 17 n=1 Tax=Thalassoglobus neptunius TaxID=1938619 RepID=A0A5C5X271_9PLAN|nr:hypothetical protein [Thalassoglobus neptunius]TWT56930.1 hypothetical protein KOR42_02860 [Thalassoglobus neptunius]
MNAEMWGLVMVVIGLFFVVSAWLKSDFFIYRMFVARSKILWRDKVHTFLLLSGVVIILVGVLMASGLL